jgi:hypothetical protein
MHSLWKKMDGGNFMNNHRMVKWMAISAIVFGAMTVLAGGIALFGPLESRAALGNTVPFVLWFNLLAGFAYPRRCGPSAA